MRLANALTNPVVLDDNVLGVKVDNSLAYRAAYAEIVERDVKPDNVRDLRSARRRR